MLTGIAEMAKKFKKEKEQKMLKKIMNALIEANQDKVSGMLKTEDAMFLVNEILTLSETNEILVNENKALEEAYNKKCDEVTELNIKMCKFTEQLKIALDGVDMYAKRADTAERTIRLEERKRVNCPKDIMQVYGYRE